MAARSIFRVIAVCLIVVSAIGVAIAGRGELLQDRPGAIGGGVTLLPNGWKIAPAGRHLAIGDLPLNMVLSPDGHSLIVTNNGYLKPTLRVVDLDRERVSVVNEDDAWLGLAWHPDGTRLYSSGAASNSVEELTWTRGRLRSSRKIPVAPGTAQIREGETRPPAAAQTFVGGIAVSPDGARLYAVHVYGKMVTAVDLAANRIVNTAPLTAEPYTCVLSPDGATLYVSLWGGARVLIFDAKTLSPKGEVAVGEHPNAMTLAADGKRLFVACANTNAVWVIDLATAKATEQISIALFPQAPPGSTPNALAVSPSGEHLLVANADNNTAAFVDILKPGESRVLGFIPTGWYPTGVLFSSDGSQVFILSGKGLASEANPRGPNPGIPAAPGQYTGSMLEGALSILATPDPDTLAKLTKIVYAVTPYSDAVRLTPAAAPGASPIPRRVGDVSAIKHVFYVIRENRTYDQILGDLDHGNGDPTLTLFGENVTPNAHALAREFVTLDNFYVNAEVSYSGHAFSTGAYSNDFVEKIWPTNYGSRGGTYLGEGGGDMRTAFGSIAAPPNGYLWDFCVRAGKSVRSYGEFADLDRVSRKWKANVPGLDGRVDPDYPGWNLAILDNTRIDAWVKEFDEFVANGQLPALSIIRLPNDHTNGTSAGSPTPRAMIAENDQALGRLVETISKSVYWKDSAIFVLEDDSQNGPDHVDAHRSPGFVISPFVRRGAVDSTLYTTAGMLRTMELILGLPPMTQYDAAATPMYNAFTTTPTTTAFARRDPRIKLDERNQPGAPGAAESALMNFTEEDLAPERELNEVLWQSIHGAGALMPPPVHAAFVRPQVNPAGDDDDDRGKRKGSQ